MSENNKERNISSFIKYTKDLYNKLTIVDKVESKDFEYVLSDEAQREINEVQKSTTSTVEKREIITNDLDKKIKSRLNGTVNLIDSRPCFLKPTYLLQEATPHVSAKLLMIGGNEGILAYDFLPPSQIGRSQNIIKSFEFDVDNSAVKLSITDADQDIIEYLGFLFSNLLLTNPPILEIEFGWAHDKEQEVIQGNYIEDPADETSKAKIDTHVYYRRNVFCYVNDFESQYTPEGVLELTFVAKISQNFPPPYQHFLPYDIIGRNPAISIQMIHSLFVFYNYFKNRNTIIYNDLIYIAEFFYYFKQIKEIKILSLIIYKVLKFFVPQGFSNNLNIKNENSNWFKKINAEVESWKKKEKKNKNKYIPLSGIDTISDGGSNNSYNILKIKEIFRSEIIDSVEELRIQLKKFNDQYASDLRNLVMDLTSVLGNAMIHPYDVIKYVQEVLKKQGIKYGFIPYKESENKKTLSGKENLFIVQGFEDESIGGYDYENNTHYNKNTEKYLIKSADIVVNPTSSWDELFNSLASKCFVWINKSNAEVLNKTPTKEEVVGEDKNKLKSQTPVSMTGNCFVIKKKEALFNLNTLKVILQARSVDSKINNLQTSSKSIELIKNTIESIKKLDNNSWVVLVSFDVIPGMNNLFDPLNGKNQILQAYSYRAGNVLAFTDNEGKNLNQYNPGYPNVWSINFPDVISFQPKFNFKNQADNLSNVMKQGMHDFKQQKDQVELELKQLQTSDPKKENREKLILEKIEEINLLKNNQENFEKYHGKIPYKNPALMMDEDPFIDISKHGEINNRRKKMQEFRKHAILSSVNIDVDMEVLGDPIFNIHSKGKYVFIRYFNQSGDLSFFTGVYIINNIKHSISSGRFTTSFTLQKDATVGSTDVAEQIFRGFTENDNCYG